MMVKAAILILADGSAEGLHHEEQPILPIQYHFKCSPNPLDSVYLFDRFLDMVRVR